MLIASLMNGSWKLNPLGLHWKKVCSSLNLMLMESLRWIAKDLTETLKNDLERYNLYEGETPHSFRHGGTVDSLKKGRSLEQTMYLAYMKDTRTAERYSRGLKALLQKGFDWKDTGVGSDQNPMDDLTLCAQMQG